MNTDDIQKEFEIKSALLMAFNIFLGSVIGILLTIPIQLVTLTFYAPLILLIGGTLLGIVSYYLGGHIINLYMEYVNSLNSLLETVDGMIQYINENNSDLYLKERQKLTNKLAGEDRQNVMSDVTSDVTQDTNKEEDKSNKEEKPQVMKTSVY